MADEAFDEALEDLFGEGEEERAVLEMPRKKDVGHYGLVPVSVFESMEVTQERTIFDIETGPLPAEQLEALFVPPQRPGEFDPASVKLGRMKDQAKIDAKIEEARAAHQKSVDEWEQTLACARENFLSDAALDARTGQVLAIGYYCGRTHFVLDHQDECYPEEHLLYTFWAHYLYCRKQQVPLIGFNSNCFDVPFLIRRSWALGVPVPETVLNGRWLDKFFVDLADVWRLGGKNEYLSLGKLAAFLRTAHQKSGSGADFAKLFTTDLVQALDYLRNDVLVTWECGEKMGVC